VIPIPDSAKELLAGDGVAHVITINPDGSPHVTLAWVGVDGEEIVFGTLTDQRKLKNIRNDPRVVVSVQGRNVYPPGLLEYLCITGRARVVEGGGAELLGELATTYLGPHVKFPPMDDPPPGFVTRVAPERISGVGPWTGS
jgi:PPOX class probable F420-dependent enzyme